MIRFQLVIMSIIFFYGLSFTQMKITRMKGEVLVRHGASELWQPVSVGDILKPHDSMKLGKQASATVSIDSVKAITIPEHVIVDLSDLRNLTQKEFLLKLAMEDVRSAPLREGNDRLNIPQTTTMHGDQKGTSQSSFTTGEAGILQLNGTKVLFENGYNETGVLKTRQVYRLYPALSKQVENRLLVASAFERLHLLREAIREYRNLLHETLTQAQRSMIETKIETLEHSLEG